jgi:ferritin-like metal-binding protein YciE
MSDNRISGSDSATTGQSTPSSRPARRRSSQSVSPAPGDGERTSTPRKSSASKRTGNPVAPAAASPTASGTDVAAPIPETALQQKERTGKLKEELAQAGASLEVLQTRAGELAQQIVASAQALEELRRRAIEISDLHHESEALLEVEARLEQLQQRTSEISDLSVPQQSLSEAEQRLEDLQRQAAALVESTRAEDLFASANARLDDLRRESEQLANLGRLADVSAGQTNRIEQQLDEARGTLQMLVPQVEDLGRQIARSEQLIENLRQRANQVADLGHVNDTLAAAEGRLEQLQQRAIQIDDLNRTHESLEQAERRVESLQNQLAALANPSQLEDLFATAAERLKTLRHEADQVTDLHRLTEALEAAEQRMDNLVERGLQISNLSTLDEALSAAERRVEDSNSRAVELQQSTRERMNEVQAEAKILDDELGHTRALIQDSRNELLALTGQLDEMKTSARNSAPAAEANGSESGKGSAVVMAGANEWAEEEEELLDLEAAAAPELAKDAREQLSHLLNDALAVEKEQVGLLQSLADSANDPDVRYILEQHRVLTLEQQEALTECIRPLNEQPSRGRGLVGQIVSHIWEALNKTQESEDAVESLLKALGVAELEVGMYLALASVARVIGDRSIAELAVTHLSQERDFVKRLKHQIKLSAIHTLRRAETITT